MKRNKNRDRLVCGFLSLILAAGMTQGCASPHVSDQSNHNSQETGEDQTPSYSYEDTDKAESSPAPAETNASSGAGKKKTPDDEKIPDDEKTPDDASKDKTDQKKNSSDASSQEENAKKDNQEKASLKSLRPLIRIAKTGRIPTKQRLRKRILKKEIITTRTDLSNMNIRRKKTPVRI